MHLLAGHAGRRASNVIVATYAKRRLTRATKFVMMKTSVAIYSEWQLMFRSKWHRVVAGLLSVSLWLPACGTAAPAANPKPMDMGNKGAAPTVPAGMAYAEGQEIRFIHTEVSDPDTAKLLSGMMNSPVLVVPSLAKIPDSALAKVYVFGNGTKGMGPLGFQPDVFDNPPGTKGYTPLRALYVVTWKKGAPVRELKAAAAVLTAEKSGELTIERKPVVINMPFITWLGGQR